MLQVNLNGSTRESLVADRKAAIDALTAATVALRDIRPHGRDYQTLPAPTRQMTFDRDVHAWQTQMTQIADITRTVRAEYWALIDKEI